MPEKQSWKVKKLKHTGSKNDCAEEKNIAESLCVSLNEI